VRIARAAVPLLAAVFVLSACEDEGYQPPDESRSIELADSLYTPALFDTIDWESDQQRIDAGNLVFADSCRRCHGAMGEGGQARVAGRELFVPSLVAGEWHLHDRIDVVRQLIFTGHTGGMPSWGIHRLTPRQIDAVAFYLLEQLRPEMRSGASAPATDG
jgi:mono/diheme cytochrome c family protein